MDPKNRCEVLAPGTESRGLLTTVVVLSIGEPSNAWILLKSGSNPKSISLDRGLNLGSYLEISKLGNQRLPCR